MHFDEITNILIKAILHEKHRLCFVFLKSIGTGKDITKNMRFISEFKSESNEWIGFSSNENTIRNDNKTNQD